MRYLKQKTDLVIFLVSAISGSRKGGQRAYPNIIGITGTVLYRNDIVLHRIIFCLFYESDRFKSRTEVCTRYSL
jgi:hypothetical protein